MEEPTTTITEDSDDLSSVKSDDSCGSNRVKLLCSYGGRILPRPGDGKLRYTGGDTRVVAASRNISFADLVAKMSNVFGSTVLLKCQLPMEDLDALVSVKSDEDLENMLEEYDRVGAREGLSKVRAFLFPLSICTGASNPPAAGHMDDRFERSSAEVVIVKPQDEGRVAVSNTYPQISQWQELQRTDLHRVQNYPSHCGPLAQKHLTNQASTRGSHPNQQHVVTASAKTGRPPRWMAVHSDAQYSSPVRYAILRSATQIHMMKQQPPPPPQQKFAGGAKESQFVCIDHSSSARVVHINNTPQVQVRFPGKSAIKAEESVTRAYKHTMCSPYKGAALHAREQFLVRH